MQVECAYKQIRAELCSGLALRSACVTAALLLISSNRDLKTFLLVDTDFRCKCYDNIQDLKRHRVYLQQPLSKQKVFTNSIEDIQAILSLYSGQGFAKLIDHEFLPHLVPPLQPIREALHLPIRGYAPKFSRPLCWAEKPPKEGWTEMLPSEAIMFK